MPIKATRTVSVTFGLVNFRCNVYTATEDSGPTLHLTHTHDDGSAHRVTTRYTCKHPECDETLGFGQCDRAVQVGDRLVPLSVDEVAALDAKTSECEVIEFVDPAEVPVEMYGQLYYVAPEPPKTKSQEYKAPEPKHARPYALLRESLRREGLVAIVSISLRNRTARGMLYVRDDLLMLRMLLWSAQVREPVFCGYNGSGGVIPNYEVSEDELAMAGQLVRVMSGKFDPDRYVDPYAAGIAALVEAKTSAPDPGKEETSTAQVIDLTARLNAAVAGRASAG
jgi:DNA end-binding protein Ku